MSEPTWTSASIKYQQRAFGVHDRFFDVADRNIERVSSRAREMYFDVAEDSLAAWRKAGQDCEDFDTALRGKA